MTKRTILLFFSFFLISTQSFSGGEFSGTGAKVFKTLTAEEAFFDNRIYRTVGNVGLPGHSIWVKPHTTLCIDTKARTLRSRKEAGFDFEIPLLYQVWECVQWAVKTKDQSKRIFDYEAQAQQFIDESSNARGPAYCLNEGWVEKRGQTTFWVDYYSDRKRDNPLGRYKYFIPTCDQPVGAPEIEQVNSWQEAQTRYY